MVTTFACSAGWFTPGTHKLFRSTLATARWKLVQAAFFAPPLDCLTQVDPAHVVANAGSDAIEGDADAALLVCLLECDGHAWMFCIRSDWSRGVLMDVWIAGIFGLVGVLLGTISTLASQWLIEVRKEENDRKKERAAKLEELVAAIYEHKHWLGVMRQVRVFGVEAPETISPFTRVEAIATVHFPNFLPMLGELETASDAYELWMLKAGSKRLETGKPHTDGFNDVYGPTLLKLREVLKELRDYAKKEFA